MTGTTISSYQTAGETLSLISQMPLYVTATGTIKTDGTDAVYVNSVAATIINQGLIWRSGGAYVAIYMGDGGTLTNDANGSIQGSIRAAGAGLYITNLGHAYGGIDLQAGGTVTNSGICSNVMSNINSAAYIQNSGTVLGDVRAGGSGALISNTGFVEQVVAYQNAILDNSGSIKDIQLFGTFENSASGHVYGTSYSYGVRGDAAAVSIYNAGVIKAEYNLAAAVYLVRGGSLTNSVSGKLTGSAYGVKVVGAAATINNAGYVAGSHAGVLLSVQFVTTGGSLINGSGGTISGGTEGIDVKGLWPQLPIPERSSGPGAGGPGAGIYLEAGGTVINLAGGLISGSAGAVTVGSATVSNAGTIVGTSGGDAVHFGVGSNKLIVNGGAVFQGTVYGAGGATNTLELGGAAPGSAFTGIGTQFVNFGIVLEDVGQSWSLTGVNTLGAGSTLAVAGLLP